MKIKSSKSAKKRDKSDNLSINREEEAKKWPLWEDYLCVYSFKRKPVNNAFKEKFALDWVEWQKSNQDCITIWKFPIQILGIAKQTAQLWIENNENVKLAYTYVRWLCAERREHGAAYKTLDSSWIAKTHPLYDDEFKELEEWRAKLKETTEGKSNPITVELHGFPSSPLVKEKK